MKYFKYLSVLIILALLIPLSVPQPVQANTAILTVTGEGWNGGYTSYYGGSADYTNMQAVDGNYVYAVPTDYVLQARERAWTFSPVGTSIINSVTIYYYASRSGLADLAAAPFVRIGGVNYYGSSSSLLIGYVYYNYTWATNPSTGVAWTYNEINSAYFGLNMQCKITTGNESVHCDYIYLSVNYSLVLPTVSTSDASTPTYSGSSHNCTLNGSIDEDYGSSCTERGFAWSLTSNTTSPSHATPPATYTSNWTETGTLGEGAFSHNIGGLTAGTTYYYRAYAKNVAGYSWGDEKSFTTLTNPSMTTQAATLVSSTSARLNAVVVSDGHQPCDVRFGYGEVSQSANCTAGLTCGGDVYTTYTAWVNDTYTTGQYPYVDITGLDIGTAYYFCVQVKNDVSCKCGGELNFTTTTGVGLVTGFNGIAKPTSISLAWTKATGATDTLIRRKTGGYPTSITDGTLVYQGTGTSYEDTGLTSGTTYYYSAWGYSGAYYSASSTTLMVTTLASSAEEEGVTSVTTPDTWFQAPDYTNMSNWPFYEIANFAFDSFSLPRSTGWYIMALIFATACGIIFYSAFENSNLFLSCGVVAVVMIFESMLKLVPLWNILPFAIVAITGIFVGERRG